MTILSERLRWVRKHAGLTQRELATRAKMARATITLYESGRREPIASSLLLLADALDVSTDYLLGRTVVPLPEQETWP